MRKLEDLQIDNIKIFQDDNLYHFTSDSILLSKFATVKKGDIVADFCAGSGIVGFNLYALNKNLIENVTFFEMQKSLFDLCKDSIDYNNLNDKFNVVNTKLQEIKSEYNGKFSLIVANPPYMEVFRGEGEENEHIAICRREVYLSFEELIVSVNKCLKYGGRFAFVNRADRLADIIFYMRKYNVEPKKLQFIKGKNKNPYLVLIEGVKGGKASLNVLSEIEN